MTSQTRQAKPAIPRWIPRTLVVVLILAGCMAALDAIRTSVWVYLTFFGTLVDPPTAEEIHRYEIAAGLAVGCLLSATILCVVFGRVRHVIVAATILIVAVGGVAVFSVPAGRWYPPEPTQEPLPDNYHPCYSGSRDCGHGG